MNDKESELDKAYRTNGEIVCKKCCKTYYEHPLCYKYVDSYGDPYLNILCNGDLVKL